MKYKVYSFNPLNSYELITIDSINLPEDVKNKLESFESLIIKEYKKKQFKRVGVKSLGNEIRYNDDINDLFEKRESNTLIKVTGNRISFFNILIDAINDFEHSSIYFVLLKKDFGLLSQLVDKTFITIEEINVQLSKLFENFKLVNQGKALNFIEINGFTDHIFVKENGYTTIHKRKENE